MVEVQDEEKSNVVTRFPAGCAELLLGATIGDCIERGQLG